MKKLILKIEHGGLGDHLFYSHIPRIAKEFGGYSEVYISNKSNIRSLEHKEFIWEPNPFVDGFTDEDGVSAGGVHVKQGETNILDEIMLKLGLDDGERFHEPEIYYQPNKIEVLEDKVIYDPNYISDAELVTTQKVDAYFKDNNVHVDHQLVLREGGSIPTSSFDSFIKGESFWDFVDILYSAKEIYCLVTGAATLAAGLKKKASVFYTEDSRHMFRHSKHNRYIKL
jgi:hypothetical protein